MVDIFSFEVDPNRSFVSSKNRGIDQCVYQWIGLRENLQETKEIWIFPVNFPSNQSIDSIDQLILILPRNWPVQSRRLELFWLKLRCRRDNVMYVSIPKNTKDINSNRFGFGLFRGKCCHSLPSNLGRLSQPGSIPLVIGQHQLWREKHKTFPGFAEDELRFV